MIAERVVLVSIALASKSEERVVLVSIALTTYPYTLLTIEWPFSSPKN